MKNKIILLCTILMFLSFSFWVYFKENDLYKDRYHEHLENNISYVNYDFSNINENTYQSSNIVPTNFSSHLPVISFDTKNQEILGGDDRSVKDYIQVSMDVFDNKGIVNTMDKQTYSTEALIRYRGNSSRFFEKKGLRLKLVNKKGKDDPYKLLGLSKDSDYVLHGPYLDKTLIRNYLGYNITGEVMDYSPNVRFCEVFINGEYQGVYLLVENVKVSKNRVNVSKLNKNSKVSSYLLEITRRRSIGDDINYLNNFSKYTNRIKTHSEYNIKYPTSSKINEELNDYINSDISDFEKILYSYDYNNENIGYSKYIDIDSFVNYVVLNEFFLNYDAGNNSTYLYKDKSGKLGLVFWDLNNIFDNYFTKILDENQDFMMKDKSWFQMLLKDDYFTERVIKRYKELRETILSEEYLYNYIDETIMYLGPAIERNFVKWGDSFTDLKNKYVDVSRNAHSYSEAIDDMKDAIHKRGEWLDDNIDTLRQFSHKSKVKDFNP